MKRRVGLVLVDDGLYAHRWAEPVLRDPRLDVAFIAALSPFSAPGFHPGPNALVSRLRYYGLLETAKFGLRYLAEKRMLRAALSPPGGDINAPEFIRNMASMRPDLLLCAFSQKAGREFLAVPAVGALNLHFSMLPLGRGREPTFYAMLTGQGAGVSCHWMLEDLDEGAVAAQRALDLSKTRTLHQAILAGCELAAGVAIEALLSAAKPERHAGPLPPLNPWPAPRDVAAFRAKGLRFI
ncbi:MAG: hypothetical protein HY924_12040 [Elusimicrobia bacterium]|nr:hypothetical protein [Elusimicrobiota bacterium]